MHTADGAKVTPAGSRQGRGALPSEARRSPSLAGYFPGRAEGALTELRARFSTISACLIPLLLAAGCGGESATGNPTPADTGAPDTTLPDVADEGVDTAFADTTPADTGVEVAADTSAGDTYDAANDWPTCDTKPAATTATTIAALWATPPAAPTYSWISGAYVTAISGAGCTTSTTASCQIFLADATSYADLAAAGKHAIRLLVFPPGSPHFVAPQVGDKVDVAAWGYRNTSGGQNELMLDVSDARRGCIFKTGTGTVAPVTATLGQLGTLAAYQDTYGPVLVQLAGVSANTDTTSVSKTTGGLFYPTMFDAGGPTPISVSPFFLSGGTFTGYTVSTRYDWATLTGVFGIFRPAPAADAGTPPTYLELYPRTMDDLVKR
jgi:hypothetical protein